MRYFDSYVNIAFILLILGMLRVFAESVGRKFIKGHGFGGRLCPEKA